MFDIVIPKNNELELINQALALGFSEIYLGYSSLKEIPKKEFVVKNIKVIIVLVIKNSKIPKSNYPVFIKEIDPVKVRLLAEKGKVAGVFGLEESPKPDFLHHRNSGVNHIVCKLFEKNELGMIFDFSKFLESDSRERAKLLGRFKQNIRFSRKFKFKLNVCSFASTPINMRHSKVFQSFFKI